MRCRALRRDHHRHWRGRRDARAQAGAVAASGSCCSSAAATCPASPRTGISREVFRKERYLADELWYDKDGNPYKPHQQYFVGGNTKFYGAILFRLRERDFHEVRALWRHLTGVADLLLGSRAVLRRGRAALPGTRSCRRGSERTMAVRAPFRIRRSRTSPASSSSPTTSSAPATTRSTCRSGSTSTSQTPSPGAACAATGSTASRA